MKRGDAPGGLWLVATLIGLAPLALSFSSPPAVAGALKVPADRAGWESLRKEIGGEFQKMLGDLPARPTAPKAERVSREEGEGYVLERFVLDNGAGAKIPGLLIFPSGAKPEGGWPAIVYLHDYGSIGKEELLRTGPDGTPPGLALARRGFAVLGIDAYFSGERRGQGPGGASERGPGAEELSLYKSFLADGKSLWGMIVRDDLVSLDYLLTRPEINRAHVGAHGKGMGATRACWLLALDERVACGALIAGPPRFADLIAARRTDEQPIAVWVPGLTARYDTEALVALCAPRPLCVMMGDADPTAPVSGIDLIEATAKKVYALYGNRGDYQHTLFGGLGHEYTLLEWDTMLEFLDKHFLPQGPTPLPHSPEPEPKADDKWTNPAENGIAGWVAEMSQRPGTWTWRDGTIVCHPADNEYGWLRAPVEFDDFVLSLEWKAPKGGNTGVFLRARPVTWTIPPSKLGKRLVSTRGLDWPSRTGLELQATDDAGHADKYSSGSLYRHAAPASNPTHPAGEWNRYTVRLRGPRVEVWSNGEQVMDTKLDRHVTLRHPPLRGYFGLQNHGVGAEFRNIRYMKLERTKTSAAGG